LLFAIPFAKRFVLLSDTWHGSKNGKAQNCQQGSSKRHDSSPVSAGLTQWFDVELRMADKTSTHQFFDRIEVAA